MRASALNIYPANSLDWYKSCVPTKLNYIIVGNLLLKLVSPVVRLRSSYGSVCSVVCHCGARVSAILLLVPAATFSTLSLLRILFSSRTAR